MNNRLRARAATLSLWIAASMGLGLSGCVQEPPPFDPREAQRWERAQDASVKSKPMYPAPKGAETQYVPGTTTPQPRTPGELNGEPEGPPVKLSLQEIIHRVVLNSLDIRVASFDTAVDQTRVMEAEANFDPAFFTNINFERIDKQSPGTFSNFDPVFNSTTNLARFNQSVTTTIQTGFQQKTPAGGEIKLQYQVQNLWTRPQQTPLSTYYDNELSLSITQPLLQNFGYDVNQARITISRNNQRVSLFDWRKTVEETVLNTEKAYWQLVQAKRDVATLERLVAASESTTNVLFHRQQADVSAPQITNADTQTAIRRTQLIRARSRVGDLSDQLKRLMDDPDFPVSGNVLIDPADDEVDTPMHFDTDAVIETALENRLELGQQQIRIDSATTAMKVAKNNLLPQLNFQGSVTTDGVARDLGPAFSHDLQFGNIGFAAGLQFQVPLGNRAARAIWARAILQRMQAIESYKQLIDQVTLDTKVAARDINTSWAEFTSARNARFLAADALAGIIKLQDAGAAPFTPESVQLRLQQQQSLAEAEQAEHQALFNYNFAIATLEKNKGTLLRYNNIILEEQQLPFDMSVKSFSPMLRERPLNINQPVSTPAK